MGICTLDKEVDSDAAKPLPQDGQLLERFIDAGDHEAFARLVERHGPYILGVCRRLTAHDQDAEDVFQACFLELSRNASSICQRNSVAGWLQSVAVRMARRVRTRRKEHRQREVTGMMKQGIVAPDDMTWRETRQILEEEVSQLPEDLRSAIITCFFQDKTQEEAGQLLDVNPRTLRARLARGRELLRQRLTGRGVTLAVLAGVLSSANVQAAVPSILEEITVRSATAILKKTALTGMVSPTVLSLTSLSPGISGWGVVSAIVAGLALCAGTAFLLVKQTTGPSIETTLQQAFDDQNPGDQFSHQARATAGDDKTMLAEGDRPDLELVDQPVSRFVDNPRKREEGDIRTRPDEDVSRAIMDALGEYQVEFKAADGIETASLIPTPALRWTNTVSGTRHGVVAVWTRGGRPDVVVQFSRPGISWMHEFCSTSTTPFTMHRNGQIDWSPRSPGVKLQPIPAAPAPADTAVKRRAQMRKFAERFEVVDDFHPVYAESKTERHTLRLLPKPLYRYEPTDDLIDGAMFGFVITTDPEALLMVEAYKTERGAEWRYALARMTVYALSANLDGAPVWQVVEKRDWRVDEPYFVGPAAVQDFETR